MIIKFIKNSFLNIITFFVAATLCFFFNTDIVLAVSQKAALNSFENTVIEHLRLTVKAEDKEAWLAAERASWGPWLSHQKGFLGRQLLWDKKREEATVLISWASKADWLNISQSEIRNVQEHFESLAKDLTGYKTDNPFPLKFEGELLPQ